MESISTTVTFEQTILKSRFIGHLIPLRNETELDGAVQAIRDAHPQASHHCFAAVFGPSGQFVRYSDDKEPHGTAGLPILHVLQGAKLTDVLVVVVRYFGGTRLGTGGLARAYSSTVQEALRHAIRVESKDIAAVRIDVSYDDIGGLEGWLRANTLRTQTTYADMIHFEVDVFAGDCDGLIETVLALSKRKADVTIVAIRKEYR